MTIDAGEPAGLDAAAADTSGPPGPWRWWSRWPRMRWRRRLALVGSVVVVALGGYYVVTLYQVWSTGRGDQARPVDAIVVMGAAQYDGRPSPLLAARLDHVVQLWEQHLAPKVVVTGGKQPGDRYTEADASRQYLVAHGVPREAILDEHTSHNSYDSLVGVRDVVGRSARILLVSDPYHSLRVRLIGEELGMVAYVSPTRTSPVGGATALGKHLKEAAGVSLGRIIGFKRLLGITG